MERRLSRKACTERECHTYTDTWCVCVYVSQSKRENHPVPQEGAWEIEWPYIHKDMVCVCVYGKRENHPVPQGGAAVGKPQNRRRDVLFHRGGRGEYTMTSSTY